MKESQEQYIVITSCKNEETNLPNLISSIIAQSHKPVLWVIVDDSSIDGTPGIIQESVKKYNWIKGIRLEESKRDIGLHLTKVIKRGLDFAIEYSNKNGICYDYLGNVDGDLILDHTFFENLIEEFKNDTKLGIASGGTNYIIGNHIVHADLRIDEPSGGHMLMRRECFEECNGISLYYPWDGVLKVKARLRGWKTKRFEENVATEIRDVNSAEGYWKGYIQEGKISFYLNHNPFYIIIRSIMYSVKRPWYTGIAYMWGYFNSFIKRDKKIDDDEIKQYYWNKWKNIIRNF